MRRFPAIHNRLYETNSADSTQLQTALINEAACRDFGIETVRKLANQKGFQPLPRR
jgi:hypothetical protein